MSDDTRIVLTGFMGVGKSTVAKHLASIIGCERVDLDSAIIEREHRTIAEIVENDGIGEFRRIESEVLAEVIGGSAKIIALGGGAWTIESNRDLIRSGRITSIWLETSFERCWLNIVNSRRVRPLARNKAETKKLFDERQRLYCLADWHYIIRADLTSYDVARQIAEEVFSFTIN